MGAKPVFSAAFAHWPRSPLLTLVQLNIVSRIGWAVIWFFYFFIGEVLPVGITLGLFFLRNKKQKQIIKFSTTSKSSNTEKYVCPIPFESWSNLGQCRLLKDVSEDGLETSTDPALSADNN